jgi:DNA-directed RNA polymerase sigma subunit (sigma70/sigma32)
MAKERAALMKQADRALTELSPLEEYVLRRRFGVGGRAQTPDAIAVGLGLRREDILHLESRALSHLRLIASSPEREEEVDSRDWVPGAHSLHR